MTEAINHPEYYGGEDNPYEVIRVLEAWDLELAKGFCWGNMIKYSARAGKKSDSEVQDRLKAEWYASRLAAITATLEDRRQSEDDPEDLRPWAKANPAIGSRISPGFTLATPDPQPSPQVGSHWIWRDPSNANGARCRVRVTAVGVAVHVTTLAIEGREDPPPGSIRSNFSRKRFFEECTPWDDTADDPWAVASSIAPKVGTEWIWEEKGKPYARCRVQVVKVGNARGNEWVKAKVITSDLRVSEAEDEFTSDLDLWHEAVTPVPAWPYSWEKEI